MDDSLQDFLDDYIQLRFETIGKIRGKKIEDLDLSEYEEELLQSSITENLKVWMAENSENEDPSDYLNLERFRKECIALAVRGSELDIENLIFSLFTLNTEIAIRLEPKIVYRIYDKARVHEGQFQQMEEDRSKLENLEVSESTVEFGKTYLSQFEILKKEICPFMAVINEASEEVEWGSLEEIQRRNIENNLEKLIDASEGAFEELKIDDDGDSKIIHRTLRNSSGHVDFEDLPRKEKIQLWDTRDDREDDKEKISYEDLSLKVRRLFLLNYIIMSTYGLVKNFSLALDTPMIYKGIDAYSSEYVDKNSETVSRSSLLNSLKPKTLIID